MYDDLYRLTNEYAMNSGGGLLYTNGYEYDLADNRTGLSDGTVEGYTLNTLNQVAKIYTVGQPPHTTFVFDLNGNTQSKTTTAGTTSYEYDYENRLVKVTYPNNSGWIEFVYDPIGRRLKTIEKDSQGAITSEKHYAYDGLDLIGELNASDSPVAKYTHGLGIDDPLIVRYSGSNYFYYKNHQGSVTDLRDASGGSVKAYVYDAYGNIVGETGPSFNRGFTYTGRELHNRSGLYYYRARFYDPELGRFLTQDPIGQLGGVNLYAYVGNSPVVYIDPLGFCALEKIKDAAIFIQDWIVVPGLSAYGTHLLAEWNPYAVIIIPVVEFSGAMYMLAVEQEYQASRSALIATASRAQAGGVDPLLIGNTLEGVELVSDAGVEAARLGFSVGVSVAFTGAK